MKRREALVSLAVSGAALIAPAYGREVSPKDLSDEQIRAMLRLNGLDLAPGEGAKVRASLALNRFVIPVDPSLQPADFDADVDA
jgi:hypothetical protein